MPPVKIDHLEFIDGTDSESSDLKVENTEFEELKSKLASVQKSNVFQIVVRIHAMAKLYEAQTRITLRNEFLRKKIEEKSNLNRIQLAQLELLRADRRKKEQNLESISLKIMEEDGTLKNTKKNINKSKEDSLEKYEETIKASKYLLRQYLEITNGKAILENIEGNKMYQKTFPSKSMSSKTKKAAEEAAVMTSNHDISRFFNISSYLLRYPLRFQLRWNHLILHQEDPLRINEFVRISFSDEVIVKYFKTILNQFNGIKVVKKSRNLVGFIDSDLSTSMIEVSSTLSANKNAKTLVMRGALFGQTKKSKIARNNVAAEEVLDFT